MMATWRELLKGEMNKQGESFANVESNTMSESEMDLFIVGNSARVARRNNG